MVSFLEWFAGQGALHNWKTGLAFLFFLGNFHWARVSWATLGLGFISFPEPPLTVRQTDHFFPTAHFGFVSATGKLHMTVQ